MVRAQLKNSLVCSAQVIDPATNLSRKEVGKVIAEYLEGLTKKISMRKEIDLM